MTLPAAQDLSSGHNDPRRWKVLAVLLLVQFMLVLDVSVVNVALPKIQADLGFSRSGLTWVVDAYILMAGGLLLLGGRLGDVFGRRRMFLVGVVIFGIASAVCGLAPNPTVLVVSRFLQGVGEALAAPAAFGLIALTFTDSKERAKAIGFFGGISGVAGTMGPILSGMLVEYASWRWIFFLNIPIALIAILLVPRMISSTSGLTLSRTGVDVPGAVLVTAGFIGIVYGAIQAASHPWGFGQVLFPLLVGVALVGTFIAWQRFSSSPLVPLRFFTDRVRVAGNTVTLLFYAVFFSQFFITTLYLQQVLHFSALRAGLSFLPFGIAVGASIGAATALIPKIGLRPVLTIGLLLTAAGALLFTRITADGSYLAQVLPASVLIALGSGLSLPSLGNAAVNNVTTEDAGLASGLQQAIQQVSGAVGLAVLATVALRHANAAVATGISPGAAITGGYRIAFDIGVGLLVLGAAVSWVLLRSSNRTTEDSATTSPRSEPVPAEEVA